jgi:DNA-directed RNA polymerase specialized sigma24 family protein
MYRRVEQGRNRTKAHCRAARDHAKYRKRNVAEGKEGEGGLVSRKRIDGQISELATNEESPATVSRLLLALLILTLDERERRANEWPNQVKSEVLLARAGLSSTAIAELVQKQPGAVRTALSRAKAKRGR